jgi:hypothetical protein
MKLLCQLLTEKVSPKILIVVAVAFTTGTISPEILSQILDLLSV